MRFPLRRTDELPFYVDSNPSPSTFIRLGRWWRSVPRLKRVLIVMISSALFLICILCITPARTTSNENQEIAENFINNVIEVKDRGIINNPEPIRKEVEENSKRKDIHSVPSFAGPQNDRQKAVRNAFKHAWSGYKKYAWGHDQLKPKSRGYSEWFNLGLTITDSLDTAMIMKLDEEVAEGTEWIRESLSFTSDQFVNTFETTIRVLGGLISSYHLSGDKMFIEKAAELGDRLLPAFLKSPTAVPLSDVNLKTGAAKAPQWSNDASLSEVATLQLEFRELSRLTENKTYEELAFKTSELIHEIGCDEHNGLCEMFMLPSSGKFKTGTTITFGARADSYYEYLLKQWLQTGKTIDWLRTDYVKAMNAMSSKLLRASEPNKLLFVGELLNGNTYSPKMDHLVCFLAGTLALGYKNGLGEADDHLNISKGIGKACRAMYENPTGLGPEIAYYNMIPGSMSDLIVKPLDAHCLLRPEAIEAWFYLYRITGDKVYQEWGWEAFEAIEKYAKLVYGYSSVNSVKKIPVTYKDMMESFFLAETLKYLYLLFADDQSEIPLDQWVFNTEAHPFPIHSY